MLPNVLTFEIYELYYNIANICTYKYNIHIQQKHRFFSYHRIQIHLSK